MALKRRILPPRPKTERIAPSLRPTKAIRMTTHQHQLKLICDGCDVVVSRDGIGFIVTVTATGQHPLEITESQDGFVKVESKR